MDPLTRRGRFAARALAVAMAATAAGCALLSRIVPGDRPLAFSHAVHVVEQELECINCHENAAMEDDPGMPGPGICELCHVEIDEKKPAERHVSTLFEGDEYRAARVSALDEEVVFSHLLHTETIEDCGACHRGIQSNARVDRGLALGMDDCTACHARESVPDECATCHTEIASDRAPSSHHHAWIRSHGAIARGHSERTMDSCVLCHQESSCADCHRVQAPRNHVASWRRRTHGLVASMDRASCAACHEPDACDRCHAEALPRSHFGSFGAPRSRHCLGCHFPLRAEGCATCHSSTPSHALAAPKPAWHTPAMNCRQCHGLSQPLPHADKGDNCNICHL